MKNLLNKETKGITLIALVITIVILIILAGVLVNLTLGDNGLFTRARLAKQKYEYAAAKEIVDIKLVDIQTECLTGGDDYTLEVITNELKKGTEITIDIIKFYPTAKLHEGLTEADIPNSAITGIVVIANQYPQYKFLIGKDGDKVGIIGVTTENVPTEWEYNENSSLPEGFKTLDDFEKTNDISKVEDNNNDDDDDDDDDIVGEKKTIQIGDTTLEIDSSKITILTNKEDEIDHFTYSVLYDDEEINNDLSKNEVEFEGNGVYHFNIKSFDNNDNLLNENDFSIDYVDDDTMGLMDAGEYRITLNRGRYLLECWGAQGGSCDNNNKGGYGGYSVGEYSVLQEEVLFANVGGTGQMCGNKVATDGGYNGGGSHTGSNIYGRGCTGGGASHIAKSSGQLAELEEKISDILIVAGGGAGAGIETSGGGGYVRERKWRRFFWGKR